MNKKNKIQPFFYSLLRDLFNGTQPTDFYNSFSLPILAISKYLYDLRENRPEDFINNTPLYVSPLIWSKIRENFPAAAVLPLGSISERAVKRFLNNFIHSLLEDRYISNADEVTFRELGSALKKFPVKNIIRNYISYWLFEANMFNLRGSSKNSNQDYGFWYHGFNNGRQRSIKNETEVRKQLFEESAKHAVQLINAWSKNKPSRFLIPGRKAMAESIEKVLKVPLDIEKWERQKPYRPINIIGIKPGKLADKNKFPIPGEAKLFLPDGKDKNILFDLSTFVNNGKKIHSLLHDLLDIASIIYLADIYIPRSKLLSRDLVFLIPVRNKEIWLKNVRLLEIIVSFLTFNHARFYFTEKSGKEKADKINFSVEYNEKCVSLFSGGLDSFIGATQLLSEKRKPIFVSHYSSRPLKILQERLFQSLRQVYPDLIHNGIQVSHVTKNIDDRYKLGKQPHQVLYQYARSFLFLSLATCVAIQNNIAEIFIYENGPVALNPTFSEALFNTRTAHPVFINYFKEFVHKVFGVDIKISNRFSLKTKGETLDLLDHKWLHTINKTNSCWSYSRVKAWAKGFGVNKFDGNHCGRCIPCIWRRSAFHHSGLEEYDDKYLWDYIPQDKWSNWLDRRHFTPILDQARFFKNILVRSDASVINFCPDFFDGEGTISDRINLYRRFAKENLSFISSIKQKLYLSENNIKADVNFPFL
jgi:7-cyano-7-deazaguanine synthase in queuosine biosynthesis